VVEKRHRQKVIRPIENSYRMHKANIKVRVVSDGKDIFEENSMFVLGCQVALP
jgi:hypothetical protein